MEARGKREAKRSASPLGERKRSDPALKARNTRDTSAFQALFDRAISQPGATYLALLGTCPHLSYSAPLALCFDFLCQVEEHFLYMYNVKAYSANSETSPLSRTTIQRRDPNGHDVQIEILFCGICHSDLHSVRNEWSDWGATEYPIVPGHEIIGRVTNVGSAVTKFKRGDLAAVGCMVDSDRTCDACKDGLEQFCPNNTLTYNSPDEHLGGVTYGGYSEALWLMNTSCCGFRQTSIPRALRRCCAQVLPRIRRCGTGASVRPGKSVWSVSADWATSA
jgi:hypothetical protein